MVTRAAPCSLVVALLLSFSGNLLSQTVNQTEILRHLTNTTPHPRLFWPAKDDAAVRAKITGDPRWKSAWEAARLSADHMLSEPPVLYQKEGRRLLGRSREALGRIMHLGFAFRITGDDRYFQRAAREMEAAAAMPDWNPSHFLDTAEMTLAMAVGYDWFYQKLSAEQKSGIRQAIEQKGLGPYLKPGSRHGWEKGGNNWNQVCHAGMVAGALALLEDDRDRAAGVIGRAVAGLPYSMKVYDPDGNYPEGPGYWNYGTTFNVMLVSMLESSVGTDFGVSRSPGFLKAGLFPLNTMGPTLTYFSFSDCGAGGSFSPAVAWFAAHAKTPEIMWFQWRLLDRAVEKVRETKGRAEIDRVFPLAIIWAEPGLEPKPPSDLAWFARGQNPIATFRTSWTDRNAVFLGIKAGTPAASHAHMDAGSFVLEARGERWSLDLGAQDYNGLEQRGIGLWNNRQNSERWQIFRYHNRAHSTLLVNDAEQAVDGKAAITAFSGDPKKFGATVDLTSIYAKQLAKAVRKFSMTADGRVVIEDELVAGDSSATVRWGMTTHAKLKTDGANKAWLEQHGKRLRMEVAAPADIVIKSWSADPPPKDYDAPNPGVSVVGFERELKAGEAVTFKVALHCPPD